VRAMYILHPRTHMITPLHPFSSFVFSIFCLTRRLAVGPRHDRQREGKEPGPRGQDAPSERGLRSGSSRSGSVGSEPAAFSLLSAQFIALHVSSLAFAPHVSASAFAFCYPQASNIIDNVKAKNQDKEITEAWTLRYLTGSAVSRL